MAPASRFSETSSKHKAALLLILALIPCLNNIVPLFALPLYFPMSSSASSRRQLLSYSSPATKQSTSEFHPQPTKHKASTSSSSFEKTTGATSATDRQFSRQLLSYSSPATKQSTSEFHPQPTKRKASTSSSSFTTTTGDTSGTDREFRAGAHEVPSGPNPESN